MRCSRDLLQQVSSTGCSKLVCETEHGEGACVCLFKMEATEENKRGSTPIIKLTRQKKKSKNRLLPGVSASGPTAASRGDEKREYFQHLPPFENSRFQALRESLPPAPEEDKQNAVKARRHRNALKTRRADGGLNALALRSERSPRRGPTRPQRSPTAYTGPSTPAAPIRPAPSAARPAPPRPAAHARHIRRRGPGPPCGGSRGVTEMLVGRCPFGIRSQHFLILMMP